MTDTTNPTANDRPDESDALIQAVDDSLDDVPDVDLPEAEAQVVTPEPERTVLPPEVPPIARATPPARPRSGLAGAVLGGVLAAGAGFGLAQFVPDGWPIADTSALEAQIAAQTADLAALKSELARVSELAAAPQPMADAGLADRIAALETAAPAQDTSAEIEALSARLAAIEAMPTGDGTGLSNAAVAALQADIAALKTQGSAVPTEIAGLVEATEARLTEVQAQADALKSQSEALALAASRRAALGQLRAALDTGAPFGAALTQLGDAEIPAVLSDNAVAGVPSLTALQASFPDAARAALEASLRADMGESWTERIGAYLRNQTGARSLTPREGTDPDAVLSRAEAALATGDLGATLSELSALPPAGLAAMSRWQLMAGARQSAVQAVASLSETLGE